MSVPTAPRLRSPTAIVHGICSGAVMNSTVPGGSGDDFVPVTTMGNIPGIVLHEISHSAFALAEEYDFYHWPR